MKKILLLALLCTCFSPLYAGSGSSYSISLNAGLIKTYGPIYHNTNGGESLPLWYAGQAGWGFRDGWKLIGSWDYLRQHDLCPVGAVCPDKKYVDLNTGNISLQRYFRLNTATWFVQAGAGMAALSDVAEGSGISKKKSYTMLTMPFEAGFTLTLYRNASFSTGAGLSVRTMLAFDYRSQIPEKTFAQPLTTGILMGIGLNF